MSRKPHTTIRIIAFLLCFLLAFQQSGFAQVAGQLDIAGYFARMRQAMTPDTFRPLHLRYLNYDDQTNTFKLLLDKGDFVYPSLRGSPDARLRVGRDDRSNLSFKNGIASSPAAPRNDIAEETKILLNYFFIGVTLPNDTFWVNLRPDSPVEIIDPYLAQTDVGKILLEADLQLKKDTAKFTSPETPEGKVYWDKLYKKAGELFGSENITIPTLTRPWIVPDEIIIRESETNAYIYKATLKVMLEQDYLAGSSSGVIASPEGAKQSLYNVYNFKDDRLKQLNEYSSQLIRELIIPKITREINASKRYAPLRQVYYSLIMAQWFKLKFAGKGGKYSSLIDRRNLDGLGSKTSWNKFSYFDAYKQSFEKGEYNIKEPAYTLYGQTIRSYFSGGITMAQAGAAIAQAVSSPGQTVIGEAGTAVTVTHTDRPLPASRHLQAVERDAQGKVKESEGTDIPKPFVGDTGGHVNEAILSAERQLSQGKIDSKTAAEMIIHAILSMLGPLEGIVNMHVAIAIMERAYKDTGDRKFNRVNDILEEHTASLEVDERLAEKVWAVYGSPAPSRSEDGVGEDMAGRKIWAKLTNVPSEEAVTFGEKFGEDAIDILQFVTGGTDLENIIFYTSAEVSDYSSPHSGEVYRHSLTTRNGAFVFYTKRNKPSRRSMIKEEYGRADTASSVNAGPKVKLVGDCLLSMKAAGENPFFSIKDPHIGDLLEAFGYALGKLHGRGVVHNDIALEYERDIRVRHIFWDSDRRKMEFIDFGHLPVEMDANKEYDLVKKALLDYYGISGELVTNKFIAAYEKGKNGQSLPLAGPGTVGDTVDKGRGGIDFTGMPLMTQPMINQGRSPQIRSADLSAGAIHLNLEREWIEIERMLSANITPSPQRIKEYLQACCANGCVDKEIDKVLGCIADILRMEEQRCCGTGDSLKEILVMLEQKPSAEFADALDKISISAGEPMVIPE